MVALKVNYIIIKFNPLRLVKHTQPLPEINVTNAFFHHDCKKGYEMLIGY